MVSDEIEWFYRSSAEKRVPKRSKHDENFWILGIGDKDVPPIYQLPKPYAVYTIRCQMISTEKLRERANQFDIEISTDFDLAHHFGVMPDYVGYTENPYRRINDHWDRFTNAANYTTLIPPKRLSRIEWFDTEEKARRRERYRAKKLKETGSFINPSLYHND